jgi:hypothetical protein
MKPSSILMAFVVLLIASCSNRRTMFRELNSSNTGIQFNNKIIENDSINPIDLTNIYNGGGVGVGDFNNDGLQDLYFTGNVVPNKLYLNKGELQFKDVTKDAAVNGEGKWCRGVAVVDINNDGWLDLYICATISKDPQKRKNILYINQGADKNGVPHFKDMAGEYGLADTSHSTMAAFFDYDNDGDLDVYIVVNDILQTDLPSVFRHKITNGSHPSTGRLYRNDWNAQLRHPVFTEVSKQAGVTIEGYGHAVSIADLNEDGWKDIFITNDFNSNDLLYINNHDGTFTDKASAYFKHTSANGMGQDVIDINNDGLADVVELDMNPEDNYRKKMNLGVNSYQLYLNSDYYGYQYQYVRNTLQLNMGPSLKEGDSVGDPVFTDIGFYSGIAETDWSWTPLVQDFNNDGLRDIIVTNGFPKDVSDHDFVAFRNETHGIASKEFTLSQIPAVKIHNYAFQNRGNCKFQNVSYDWGFQKASFSNGAVYADLDNDGDLDVIINNINDEAMLYENTLDRSRQANAHYLDIKLQGDSLNRNGLGAKLELFYKDQKQVYEQNPYRGYLSTIPMNPHFGLGSTVSIDSLVLFWPNNKRQVLQNVRADQTITLDIHNAKEFTPPVRLFKDSAALFREITDSAGISYVHKESDFIDFNIQKLLPHKFSEYGPPLAVGDLNGDGLDDMIVGGSSGTSASIFLQQKNGKFSEKQFEKENVLEGKKSDELGISLFDADGDDDLDLYIASGGYEHSANSDAYQDRLYINDGRGNLSLATNAIPKNMTSKSCVRAADFDKDGDMDLFVAGRVIPGQYPKPTSCFIYRNDSKNGRIIFTDVTTEIAPSLVNIGLTCDAIWTDYDNDGWPDLILAGEWMPVTFLHNKNGKLQNITASTQTASQVGWWSSIVAGDFDNDGDIDYVVGNLGLNSFYCANDKYPVSIYAKDFDKNGSYDAVPTIYLRTSMTDTSRKEYPAQTRDDLVKQMVSFRNKFQNHKTYAAATFDKMFTKEEMKDALVLRANNFAHCFIRNLGNGKFEMIPLAQPTQYSCIDGMVADDFDGDGNLDLIINGNDYGTEPSVGRYDGCNGILLKGDGNGGFIAQSILQSGIFIPGNGKSLVKLRGTKGEYLVAASQNRGRIKVFSLNRSPRNVPAYPTDVSALVKFKNGKLQKREFYSSSFLSQSARFVPLSRTISSVEFINEKGTVRTLSLK